MIKISDFKRKLSENEVIRISDINGLTLILKGTKKGTTYRFEHRCTFNGKRISYTIPINSEQEPKAQLNDARTLCQKRMDKVANNIDPNSNIFIGELKLKVVIEDYLQVKSANVRESTTERNMKMINKYLVPFYDCLVCRLNAKTLYNDIFTGLIAERKHSTIHKLSGIVVNAYDLASANYPNENIPNIKGLKQMLPKEQGKHLPSLTDGNIKDNIIQINNVVKLSSNMLIHHLYELSLLLLLRQNEVTTIKIKNIDFENKVLHIEQTKTLDNGFRVPLSEQAIKVIKMVMVYKKHIENEYLFENRVHKLEPINASTLNAHFKRNGLKGLQTAHGLRAIGRTWLEQQDIKFEVAEACLSHFVGSNTVKAYRRTDYLEERKEVMQKWANFLESIK